MLFSFPLQASKVWMLICGIYADFIFQRSCIPKASLYFPISCCSVSVFGLFVSCAHCGTGLSTCCFTSCWKLVLRGTTWCWPLLFYRPGHHAYCSSKHKYIKDFLSCNTDFMLWEHLVDDSTLAHINEVHTCMQCLMRLSTEYIGIIVLNVLIWRDTH